MPNIDYQLVIITLTALGLGLVFSYSVRGILYHSPDTDNELIAYAAAQSYKWRWLSDVHKYGAGKTSMKDVTIILLALFQRIMGDKESDHPYTTLTGFAVSVSAILIYLIGANYWGTTIGLFISFLYLFSLWSWQISLYGGHINISTTFFLISIYLLSRSSVSPHANLYLALSGVTFCWTMFSSASAMKYLIPFWTAIFYTKYDIAISHYSYAGLYKVLPIANLIKYEFLVLGIVAAVILVAFLYYRSIIKNMYYNKTPRFLNNIIKSQEIFPLDHYFKHALKKLKNYSKVLLWFTGIVVLSIVLIPYAWPILFGFLGMLVIFTMPDVKGGIIRYFLLPLEGQRKTQFRAYVDYFAKKGITVYRNTRGAGWSWVPRVFWRFAPLHVIVFVSSFLFLLITHIYQGQLYFLSMDLVIFIISTSPIWWAEFTKAPQLSRSYSTALITSLLFVGYAFYTFSGHSYLLPLEIVVITSVLIWNLWRFLSDVYPARMGATKLFSILNRLNIKEIYTYNTKYNRALVETIPGLGESEYTPRKKIAPPLAVHYINSITDVGNGWIVIPGTNGISFNMSTEPEAINENFRYTKDPVLNKLIESHKIERVATAKIKTYGTSRIWPLDSEVLGYMDLILHEIKPEDIYRGYAWLIHSSRLKI